jgi:hypothetical protein
VSERFRRLIGAVAVIVLCGVSGACARPLGDFGRPRDSVIHDEVLPALGKARARLGREPVSSFNLTDQEEEMHDRIWRFLVSPHASDWFMDIAVELQRTRIAGAVDRHFKPDSYYRWLHQRRYASSRIRFRTIADDANTDVDTAPSTFAAICRVLEVDRQRATASFELDDLGGDEVAERRAENEMFIGWFTRALRYRYEAYGFALDYLLVETPHEEAIEADAEISSLAIYVERAERGDFCLEDDSDFGRGGDHPIPSRLLLGPAGEGEFRK